MTSLSAAIVLFYEHIYHLVAIVTNTLKQPTVPQKNLP